MCRNLYNFLWVLVFLFVVISCVCRSDRDSGPFLKNPDSANSDDIQSNTRETIIDNSRSDYKGNDDGDFLVEYGKVENPAYKSVDEKIRADKTLEKAAVKLNGALTLPKDITLRAKDCKESNAFYDQKDSSVTVCYELMEYFYRLFRENGKSEAESNKKMFDAVQFVFLHEIGHALIDVYDLPITGNEEDAADRCSAYINLEELGDEGVNAVIAAADAFRLEARGKVPNKRNLADEHLLNEQRFYNSLCMIYGSNVEKYGNLVSDGYLPVERAERCPGEYERMVESWVKLLKPWRKN